MSRVRGLKPNSPFADLLGEPPTSKLLAYVHDSWLQYVKRFQGASPPLQKRREPQLSQGLAAYLRQRQDDGEQPFAGDFFGELSAFVLDQKSGLPKCIARTDIEWRLYGTPAFIIEFKVLDGKKQRREQYLEDGVKRFVHGRYSSSNKAGAMFGLLRQAASQDAFLIRDELKANGSKHQCIGVANASQLLPNIAEFDSTHNRITPHLSPFQLAHLFAKLP